MFKPRRLRHLCPWLYVQCLLWHASSGDPVAWRRLQALARLRTRRRLQTLSDAISASQALGVDPLPIERAFLQDIFKDINQFQI